MTNRIALLKQAEQARCAAMLANDQARLAELLDDDLIFSHATGAIDDKPAYLTKMASGRIIYDSIDWSEDRIVDLGDSAFISGRMTSHVSVEKVSKRLNNRVLSVWVWKDGWKMLAFQSTPLT